MINHELHCEDCKAVLGNVSLEDDTTEAEITRLTTTGYLCQECANIRDAKREE